MHRRLQLLRPASLLLVCVATEVAGQTIPARVRTVQERADSIRIARYGVRLTDEHLRTAYSDEITRRLVQGAREARFQLESTLQSYDATGYQRVSIRMSAAALGRERLAYRREGAIRVRWRRDVGAVLDVEGARAVAPILDMLGMQEDLDRDARGRMSGGAMQLPYYPGQETLWIGADILRYENAEDILVHPFATDAEGYYKYSRGDSLAILLPDGKAVQLIELRITPRTPSWFLIVGSFWLDSETSQLVRAAYRGAEPIDLSHVGGVGLENAPGLVRSIFDPMQATMLAVTVEYALFDGGIWLPSLQTATGLAQLSFLRLPMELEQRFTYRSVNGPLEMADIPVPPEIAYQDSLSRLDSLATLGDSTAAAEALAMRRSRARETAEANADLMRLSQMVIAGDSLAARSLRARIGLFPGRCTSRDDTTRRVSQRYSRTLLVMTVVPCNDSLLRTSSRLPADIMSESDSIRGLSSAASLAARLGAKSQARFNPEAPTLRVGVGNGLMRYNRVEGLSPAVRYEQLLGAGVRLDAMLRVGTASGRADAQITAAFSSGQTELRLGAYDRLIAANDWGNPFSAGASLQALLFGRDEGFYFRARGAEVVASFKGNPMLQWRLFAERQAAAPVAATFSLAEAWNDVGFRENITAVPGDVFGSAFLLHHSAGTDPQGLRLLTDLRIEQTQGRLSYLRGLADVTVSTGVAGILAAAVTVSAGSSEGRLPAQRAFRLGGTRTLRGHTAGALSGDSFWMARAEVGTATNLVRPVVFADAGWAGDRAEWSTRREGLRDAGAGLSFFDGVFRFDAARPIDPSGRWRFSLYLESRF